MEQELHTQRSWPIEKCSSLAAHDEDRRCRSSSTTKRTCLLLRSIKWLLVPRLGKAERLSPSLRRKHEGKKTGRLEASLLATQRRSITAYMLSFA